MNYKERMLFELLDLQRKICKIETHLSESKTHDELLEKQLNCMMQYFEVLQRRLLNELMDKDEVYERN